MAANVETMAYKNYAGRGIPWHKLGNPFEETDLVGPETMMMKAGLEWNVVKVPSYINYQGKEIQNGFSLVRDTDGSILTDLKLVGKDYVCYQNKDMFDFIYDFAGDDVHWETAGSLRKGRFVWALAQFGDPIEIRKGDEVINYFLFHTTHDASGVIALGYTPTRVVCQNTLMMALNSSALVRVSHRGTFDKVKADLAKGKMFVDLANDQVERAMRAYNSYLYTSLNKDQIQEYFRGIVEKYYENSDMDDEKKTEVILEKVEAINDVFENAKNSENTLWDAFNAVVETVDYPEETNGAWRSRKTPEGQIMNIINGQAAQVKYIAQTMADQLVGT